MFGIEEGFRIWEGFKDERRAEPPPGFVPKDESRDPYWMVASYYCECKAYSWFGGETLTAAKMLEGVRVRCWSCKKVTMLLPRPD